MRRVTKTLLSFLFGILLTVAYCEFIIYYVVVGQCQWPTLGASRSPNEIRALMIADTHLLGPRKGHWLDKWRREWQMHQAFQAIMALHKPETVFVLGDLFDEGEWSNNKQFQDYVHRFYKLFSVPDYVSMQIVVGNHDIGFHYNISPVTAQRFFQSLNTSSVKMITLKDSHFVLINSMAMQGDACQLCREATNEIEKISSSLECARNPDHCHNRLNLTYSRPILLQHFPLYRKSDSICTDEDAPPLPLRNKLFRNKIDALSLEATQYLTSKIRPRAVFGGHTHHGCLVHHKYAYQEVEFYEYSVPSFSWRNRPNPKYMLVTITPELYAVNKCGLPLESTILIIAVILLSLTCYFSLRRRPIGR